MIGRALGEPFLNNVGSRDTAIEPSTALGLLLSGIAGALRRDRGHRVRTAISVVAAFLVLVLGVSTLAEYAFDTDWRFSDFAFDPFVSLSEGGYGALRPGAPAALALTFLGSALVAYDYRPKARLRPSEWLILAAALAGLIAFTGYIFHVGFLYRWSRAPSVGIAPMTALGLLFTSTGLLLQRPSAGLMRLVTSRGPGGVLLRRLALPLLLTPASLALIVMQLLRSAGVTDVSTVLAVFSTTAAVMGLVVLAISAVPLNRVHEALEASRARSRALIDRAPDGVFVADPDGNFTAVNAAAVRMLGYTPDELVGKTIFDLIMPEHAARLALIRQRLSEGTPDVAEWALRRKDGTALPVEISETILPDGRWQAIVRDISERKRLEEELRLAEAKASGIISTSADAIICIDEAGRMVLFNEGAEQIFGYSKAEAIGASAEILIPERFRAGYSERLRQVAEGPVGSRRIGQASTTVYGLRKSGEEFPVDAAVSKLEVEHTVLLTVVIRDISDLKRVEYEERFLADVGAILASTLDLEATLTSIGELAARSLADVCIVYAVSDEGEVRRVRTVTRDPALSWVDEVLAGVPLDRARSRQIWSALQTPRSILIERVPPEMARAFEQSDAHRQVLSVIEPKSIIMTPLSAHGKLRGAITLISTNPQRTYTQADVDFAEKVAQRAALALDNARLYANAGRAIRIRDEILGVVAHDLRNPLSTITLQAALLRRRPGDLTGQMAKAGEVITRAATRMDRLIQDLLDVARMAEGSLSISQSRVSVRQALSDCAQAEESLVTSAGLVFRIEAPDDLPELWADRDRLLQVLENLIGNAIKFTKAGGRILVSAERHGDHVLFRVADTGAGIGADDLPHIFDRFWQARKSGRAGAGLGLTIVRGIVEAHGGRIWVESAVNRGTCFFFTIPVAPRAADKPSIAAAREPAAAAAREPAAAAAREPAAAAAREPAAAAAREPIAVAAREPTALSQK